MNLDLAALGITQEDLQDRVVERIADSILHQVTGDEDGNEFMRRSDFAQTMDKLVRERIKTDIERLADKHVLPKVTEFVENITIQATNKYGEAKGEPLTFIEYLVHAADNYLREEVDYNGKSKKEADNYSWSGKSTRVAFLVNQHLYMNISTAMTKAVAGANQTIAGGLQAAVNKSLVEIAGKLTVETKVKQ